MIIGIAIFIGLGFYLLISVIVVWLSVRAAKRRGKSGWLWGSMAATVLYLLVFWDWIPTQIMYRNYCSHDAGFTLFKTLDEWKRENPGVAQTLVPSKQTRSTREGDRERYKLNQRFSWDIIRTMYPLHIREREERIIDSQTGEVLARYVDFSTTQNTREPHSFYDLKIWVGGQSCEVGNERRTKPKNFEFNEFMYLVQHQKEYEK